MPADPSPNFALRCGIYRLINPATPKKLLCKYLQSPQSFFKLYTYLAWVANAELPYYNINDTLDFDMNKKIFEGTIRYKNIEWTFSFGWSDFEGHKGKSSGETPHFHMQRKIDDLVNIKFNDTHIPLQSSDFLYFEMIRQGALGIDPSFAAGIQQMKTSMHVFLGDDNSVCFIEQISDDTQYKTIVAPGITPQQVEEISDIFADTKLLIFEIIDKLNKEKDYNLKYLVFYGTTPTVPIKSNRH